MRLLKESVRIEILLPTERNAGHRRFEGVLTARRLSHKLLFRRIGRPCVAPASCECILPVAQLLLTAEISRAAARVESAAPDFWESLQAVSNAVSWSWNDKSNRFVDASFLAVW